MNDRETDPNETANDAMAMVCEFLDSLLFPNETAGTTDEPLIGLWARSPGDSEVKLINADGLVEFVAMRLGENDLVRKAVTVAASRWTADQRRIATP